jgi:hypothetical protein
LIWPCYSRFGPGPFRQRPDADRENTLGYFWPPHLYQGKSKLEEKVEGVNEKVNSQYSQQKIEIGKQKMERSTK